MNQPKAPTVPTELQWFQGSIDGILNFLVKCKDYHTKIFLVQELALVYCLAIVFEER
jgi:hypothetical protein